MNLPHTKVLNGVTADNIPESVFASNEPVVLKGFAKHWPLVTNGLRGAEHAANYLKKHYNGKPAGAYYGAPDIKGRYFYNEDFTALNFTVKKTMLGEVLDTLITNQDLPNPPSIYIASNNIDTHFPSLKQNNNIALAANANADADDKVKPITSIWVGNKTLVSCHYDALSNIACNAVGHRTFTMFPPSQIHNIYPGPLSPTPGGQAVSMVDFKNPDFNKYPNFRTALAHGQVANLEPGDGLYIPTMWWHQVEGLDNFNVLVNFWWTNAPDYSGKAMTALLHALLSLRDQPENEKEAWKHIFDYYIFSSPDVSNAHIPHAAQGILGAQSDARARQLKAMIMAKLTR